jgi:hypothetical protein
MKSYESFQQSNTASIFTDKLGTCVEVVSQTYKERDFQYAHTGGWTLPDFAIFLSEVEALSRKVEC